jgi:hypothetical protein
MKKGRLSKKEQEYISKNQDYITPETIAEKMNRSVGVVSRYIEKLRLDKPAKETVAKEVEPQPATVEKTFKAGTLFARNKKQGVTVMTEAASIKGDNARDVNRSQPTRQKGMIHIIKKD